MGAQAFFVAPQEEEGMPVERFAIIDSTLREGEQFSNAPNVLRLTGMRGRDQGKTGTVELGSTLQ